MRTTVRIASVIAAALLLAAPQLSEAQGRGRPKRPQTTVATPPSAASGSAVAAATADAPLPTFRQFGVWLDDASSPAAGSGSTSVSAGYWRMPGGHQLDVPILDAAYGVTNRLQLAATVPFYRASYLGATARGLDDVYISAKIVAIDPAIEGAGFAVTPVMEVLGTGWGDGRRVHWALPLSAEVRTGPVRVYGSGGYFSRGAVFSGGAVEWSMPAGTLVTAAITQSYSTSEIDPLADAASRLRVDATVGLAQALSPSVAVYGAVGRSLTSVEEGGTSLAVSGGFSFRFARTAAP